MDDRKEWVDNLRGFAIVLVMVGHIIGGLVQFDGENNWLRTIIYQFHTPLLFIISGYIAKEYCVKISKKRDYIIFLKKQLMALYVPYLIWGTCFWMVKYFVYQGNESVTIINIIRLPIDFTAWVPGWFLLALLEIRLLDRFFDEINILLYLQGIIWCICWLLAMNFGGIYPAVRCCMEYGIYYYIGKMIKRCWDNEKVLIMSSTILIVLGIGLHICKNYNFSRLCLAIGISIALMRLFSSKRINTSWLCDIGIYSMVPYALHAYFTIPVRIVLSITRCDCFEIYVLAETFIAIVFSYLMIHLTKKYKSIMWLFYPSKK